MFKRFEQPKLHPELERDPKKLSYSEKVHLAESLEKHKNTLISQIAYYEKLLKSPEIQQDKRLYKIHEDAQTNLQEQLIRANKLLIKAENPEL